MTEKLLEEYFEYLGGMQSQDSEPERTGGVNTEQHFSLLDLTMTGQQQGGVFRLEFNPRLNHLLFKILFFLVATSFVFCLSVLAAYLMLKTILCIRSSLQVVKQVNKSIKIFYVPTKILSYSNRLYREQYY